LHLVALCCALLLLLLLLLLLPPPPLPPWRGVAAAGRLERPRVRA
jgi:hypothetical protein